MELTIEQALQRGVAAHKEGKLQDAERLYRAILQSQPTHPDANHNLGVLTVSVNKTEAALPFFKAALEANPKIDHFWLSYIDALIKEKQFDNAKQVLERAKKRNVDQKQLSVVEIRLRETVQISPLQEQLTRLVEHYQTGRLIEAEKLAVSVIQEFPEHPIAWKTLGMVLVQTGRVVDALTAMQKSLQLAPQDAEALYNFGVTLQELGRLDEAIASYTQAIALKPVYAKAHNNLGVMLSELGRLDEAMASFTQAIALKPDYAEAYYNLGNTLQELRRLDEAIASYTQTIALKPDYAKAHNNLGNTLKQKGRLGEAIASYTQAIALKPNFAQAYVNFGLTIKNVRYKSSNPELYTPLTQLLTAKSFTRPKDIAKSILSLLKHDPHIKNLLPKENFAVSLNEAIFIIEVLDRFPLLHYLMRLNPLPELRFEELFVAMRNLLLNNLDKMEASPELIYFLSTLSIHCFVNEYVYFESDEETLLINELQAKINHTITQSAQPKVIETLCLATYRPLHHYDWCQKLNVLDHLTDVKARLIEQPLAERMIAKDVPVLEEISDKVSVKVRKQYEENPYPRWEKLGTLLQTKSISDVCSELKLYLHSESIKNVTAPAILIAGCGTGQHSIQTASRFSNCHVTAVDLSLASLAYAQRKSMELRFTNIDYLQADILNLHKMGKEFDIIESGGVLHHMDDPMAGWRVLVDLLKPGGLMNIGLYSELARQHIVKVRQEITALKIGTSEADIRKYRQSLAESYDENHRLLTTSSDFYSLSTLRDLIFHVQEHRFNLQQIKNCLNELGLKFCGFSNQGIVSNFREINGNEADIYDLQLWHQYEERNPRTFAGMYQFWCQKP